MADPSNYDLLHAFDFDIRDGVVWEYNGLGGEVLIPDTVQEIDMNAFRGCKTLEEVIIPKNVTKISFNAFEECCNLKAARISASVTEISSGAFKDCPKLIIYAPAGSYATLYAQKNGIPYKEE